jgi:general secretion pathway protein F
MSSTGNEPQRVTLEDLAALNHEVSALVRSGWPLEAGLRQVADELSAGSGRLAARLEEETAAGKTLSQAIAAQGESLPAVYRAVVEAGLKSGRLAAALEGYAETAARMAALRRIAGQAAVYPLIVIIVAWILFVVVATSVMPGYEVMQLHDPPWLSRLRISAGTAWALALVGPVVLIALASMWWRTSGTAAVPTSWRRWFQWAPGARRTTQLSAQANFADLLRLLLVCRVPMTEALPLAASASGGASLEAPASELAARLAAGQPL